MHADDPDLPLHAMNPTGRFSARAADYARFRPDYPAAAWDAVLEGMGDPAALTAADIGAGTGISSRALAERGLRVIAVEPNDAMRGAAAPHPRVGWRQGTAEATGLDPSSVHLIVCAQAFHWFRQDEAIAEFHRVLRAGGRLALVWNGRDQRDPLTRGYVETLHAVGAAHPAEKHAFDPGVVTARGLFEPPRFLTFGHRQELDLEGLIGRAVSDSYAPGPGAERDRQVALLTDLFERHRDTRGRVAMVYETRVWTAGRR